MNYLIQMQHSNKMLVHGTDESVSTLVAYYYKWRKQYGYMTIQDDDGNVLATLGSE